MIFNLTRTILEGQNYLGKLPYPRSRILIYAIGSIFAGILLSNSTRAADLPILTLSAILFGFTLNAVVLLGNSSNHYLGTDGKHSKQLENFYKKSLYISIHTLGVGILTILIAGVYQLYPEFSAIVFDVKGIEIELISTTVYSLTAYYLAVFSLVISSTAELVKIRI